MLLTMYSLLRSSKCAAPVISNCRRVLSVYCARNANKCLFFSLMLALPMSRILALMRAVLPSGVTNRFNSLFLRFCSKALRIGATSSASGKAVV